MQFDSQNVRTCETVAPCEASSRGGPEQWSSMETTLVYVVYLELNYFALLFELMQYKFYQFIIFQSLTR